MGILSWLFPSDADLLRRARARMADGRWEDARKLLVHCKAPEAEALYDECSTHIDKGEREGLKKRLAAEGFHGWRVDVASKSPKLKAELEGLITEELAKAGVDLAMPDLPETAQADLKRAMTRAQKRVKRATNERVNVQLVPMMEEKLARQIDQAQRELAKK